MSQLFRYFWFIAAVFMLINVAIWRRRLAPLIQRGTLTQQEADGFLRGATIWLVGGSLIAGFITVWAGWPTPFCAGIFTFGDLPSTLMAVSWLASLWWVWRGNGANLIARLYGALSQPRPRVSPSPAQVRLFVTAFVVFSGIVTPIIWRQMPPDPTLACPAPQAVRSTEPR
jgi:hypothetical protein